MYRPSDEDLARFMLKEFGYTVEEIQTVQKLNIIEDRLRENLTQRRIFGKEITAANDSLLKISKRKLELMGVEELPEKAKGISDLNYNGQEMEHNFARHDMILRAEALERSKDPHEQELGKQYREIIVKLDTETGTLNEQIEKAHEKREERPAYKPKTMLQKKQEWRDSNKKIQDEANVNDRYAE